MGKTGLLAVLLLTLAPPAPSFADHITGSSAEPPGASVHQKLEQPRSQPWRSGSHEPALLGQLIAEALANNPDVLAAGKEREAAQHRILPAGALDDPMLEVGVLNLPTQSRRFDTDSMTMKMIGLAQKFPYPGKRGLRQDVAAKDAESVGHAYLETVNRVVRDVKVAYFDLSFVTESTRLTEKNRQILDQFLKIAEARYTVGQAGQADVLKAQTQVAKMADELIRLGRERVNVEAELNRALGRKSDSPAPPVELPRLHEAPLRLDALREMALQERPQLRALQSLIARGEKELELARREYYPDFDVRFSYGQRDTLQGGMRQEDMVSFTVAINLPVWRETKLAPRVAEQIALHDQHFDMYRAQQNEISSKLRQQVASAEQNLKSARLYETGILPQARLSAEAALAAYKVSRADFLSLMDSQMTVLNYEISYASAVVNYNKALAEIEFLTGKPLP